MELLENEKLVLVSENQELMLTSHRIRHEKNSSGLHCISITLDKIDSITVQFISQPVYLLLSIACVIGIWPSSQEADGTVAVGLVMAAVILAALYFRSRKHIVQIRSAANAIEFQTADMKKEKVLDFIHKVEQAKVKWWRDQSASKLQN